MRLEHGEKETAAAILAELAKKYGVSLDDLDEEHVKSFDLEFHGEIERKLLLQIAYKITGLLELVGVPVLAAWGEPLLGIEGLGAKMGVTVVVILLNYIFSKLLIFKK